MTPLQSPGTLAAVVIPPERDAPVDLRALAREAAALLSGALAALHLPTVADRREQHRDQLDRAIETARAALVAACASADAKVAARARLTLLRACAARAEDARHGAGQLSLSAQRAPTCADCDDGWERVRDIVRVAEVFAEEATRIAAGVDDPQTRKTLRAVEAAARAARRILVERNQAYTFHAEPGFSFGEGWYLAAAAVLTGVTIQIEPAQPQTTQAERFLRDAGLSSFVVPYRSRPRANKHLPEIIARAFRADPVDAQQKLRRAFLADEPPAPAVVEWIDARLARASREKKVLLWLRYGKHQPARNTSHAEILQLSRAARAAGLLPILVGDALRGELPPQVVDMTLFWKDAVFQGSGMRRAQLQFFEHLKGAHGLVGQLGVTTAGMDGPALLGLPTMYLTDAPNVRLGTWVGAVPDYEEIVRSERYLDRVTMRLLHWARTSDARAAEYGRSISVSSA